MRQLDVGLALSQSWPHNEEMSVRRFGGGDHLVIRHQGTYRDLVVMLARVHAACDLDMDLRHDGRRPSVILFREEPPGTPGEPFEAEIGLPVCAQLPERPMRHAQDGLSV